MIVARGDRGGPARLHIHASFGARKSPATGAGLFRGDAVLVFETLHDDDDDQGEHEEPP